MVILMFYGCNSGQVVPSHDVRVHYNWKGLMASCTSTHQYKFRTKVMAYSNVLSDGAFSLHIVITHLSFQCLYFSGQI